MATTGTFVEPTPIQRSGRQRLCSGGTATRPSATTSVTLYATWPPELRALTSVDGVCGTRNDTTYNGQISGFAARLGRMRSKPAARWSLDGQVGDLVIDVGLVPTAG